MTRDEILAMEPGRKLDVAVYRKVMTENWERGMYSDIEYETAPHYSTDISAAWGVLEKFPISMIERVEVFEGNITVNVSIYSSTNSDKVCTASSNSFSLSVCKAALLAVLGV